MAQMLLFPDPRPLVERMGHEFFRQAPASPGVYLMRDATGAILYIGKAKNLRQRLSSYRVANPERLPRRHLRLLRAAARIDLEECPTEAAALDRESELLRRLRPPFNRAGTWPGSPRFLAWRVSDRGLELGVAATAEPGWSFYGPLGAGAFALHATLLRLLWCVVHPHCGLAGMPAGWFRGGHGEMVTIPRAGAALANFDEAAERLSGLFAGDTEAFSCWVRERTPAQVHPFELAAKEADLEAVGEFAKRRPLPDPEIV